MANGMRVEVTLPDQKTVEGEFHQFGWSEKGVFAIVELGDGTLTAPYLPYVKVIKPKKVKR